MRVWKNAQMSSYNGDGLSEPSSCEVRIGNGSMAVSYPGEAGHVVYEGPEIGDGHFKLTASSVKGKGTLHLVPGEDILEGWWHEGGYEGMWRIELDD